MTTMEIVLGWWLVPTLLTLAAWVPVLLYKPSPATYFPDIFPAILAGLALLATCLVWIIYFAAGWAFE